eukprot:TRINITY_DN2703_c0_g1_i1.p1 TRINITY_DN2703_c0_g1~~TRINITY_DN2703_c0_g1_i1.p1  ORF type:complete len:848 (+),score=331.39 TRINITY_DN2703_c0_g1_i1:56-2599(+)
MSEAEVQALFSEWDDNGDGTITYEQLAQLMQLLDSSFTDDYCKVLVTEVDKNKDGKIQYGEFLRWLLGDVDGGGAVNAIGQKLMASKIAEKEAREAAQAKKAAAAAAKARREAAQLAAKEAAESKDAKAAYEAALVALERAKEEEREAQEAYGSCTSAFAVAQNAAAEAADCAAQAAEALEVCLTASSSALDILQAAQEAAQAAEEAARLADEAAASGNAEAAAAAKKAAELAAKLQAAVEEAAAEALKEKEKWATKVNGVQIYKSVAASWLEAAIKEWVCGEGGKIGELFDSGIPEEMIKALEPCEVQVVNAGDKVQKFANIVASWGLPNIGINGKMIPNDYCKRWLVNCMKEYIKGEAGKIGEFFDFLESIKKGDLLPALEECEVAIKGADDKVAKFAEVVLDWGLPGGHTEVEVNGTKMPSQVLMCFLVDVGLEYIDGQAGKIGEQFDLLEKEGKGDMIGALEPFEVTVRDADNKMDKLAELYAEFGIWGEAASERFLAAVDVPGKEAIKTQFEREYEEAVAEEKGIRSKAENLAEEAKNKRNDAHSKKGERDNADAEAKKKASAKEKADKDAADANAQQQAMIAAAEEMQAEVNTAQEIQEEARRNREEAEADVAAKKAAYEQASAEAADAAQAAADAAAAQQAAEQKAAEEAAQANEAAADAEKAAQEAAAAAAAEMAELAAAQAAAAVSGTLVNGVKIPTDVVAKWIAAAIKELINGEGGKIGELFDTISDDQIGALEPFELKIKDSGNKAVAIATVISDWAKPSIVINDVKIAREILCRWIESAILEYIQGQGGKIGELFDTLNDAMIGALEPFELKIKDAGDKELALGEAVTGWGLPGN